MANIDVETAATKPKSATADGHSAEAHSLPDQIAADRYTKSNAAVRDRRRGLNLVRLSPPGTV